MTWWNKKSKPEDEPNAFESTREGKLGNMSTLGSELAPPPPDPEPDLSTKPADIVGFCFGYVCPEKHVGPTFESITMDGYKERRACDTCGAVAKPATIRRIAEAMWLDCGHRGYHAWEPLWCWTQYFPRSRNRIWNHHEFVHFLDTPKPARRKK